MKKNIITLFLAITLCNITLGQTQSKNAENQTESNADWKTLTEDKYEIKYPSTWEVDKSGQLGTKFIIFSPIANEADKFKENVNLVIQDLSSYQLNLDQYVEISIGQIETMITSGKLISSDRKKKNDQEYHRVIFSGKQGIFDLKFEQFYWVIDNQAIILTLTTEKEEFKNYQEIGEKILNSFKLE